jgi:queuosine precursor transporter
MKEVQKYLYAAYCVGLVLMNILASKQMDINLFTINLGLFISPIVFIILDVQSEVYGYKSAKNLIFTGFVVNIAVAVIYFIAIKIPPSVNYMNQEAFRAVCGSNVRITIASVTAYYIGSLINSKVMVGLKKWFDKFLFFRAIGSTIAGQIVDNMIFMTLAFAGVLPAAAIITMVIGGTIIETGYEVIFYPITRAIIKKLKA